MAAPLLIFMDLSKLAQHKTVGAHYMVIGMMNELPLISSIF
jgi:hypothetical protein